MAITIEIVDVTPAMAEQWLGANKTNRKLREGVSERYAQDMTNGAWTQCTSPIAFYADGELADGQHRLWAVVESGKTVKFPVARGLSRDDGLNIDMGLNRTLVDNARIAGVTGATLSNTLIGVVRAMETGGLGKNAFTNAQVLELVAKHQEAALWAIHNGPRKQGMRNACILAALGRAYAYETDLVRLQRFGAVLDTGFANGDEDTAAVALRNYLLEKGGPNFRGPQWHDTFKKVQNAIRYFMLRKRLTVIRSMAEEVYPMVESPTPRTIRSMPQRIKRA